jgi:hypothetical protein
LDSTRHNSIVRRASAKVQRTPMTDRMPRSSIQTERPRDMRPGLARDAFRVLFNPAYRRLINTGYFAQLST